MIDLKQWMTKISDALTLKVYHSGAIAHATRISAYRTGRNAILDVVILKDLPTGQYTSVLTLPQAFYPIINIEQDAHVVGANTGGSVRIRVTTAGSVEVYNYTGVSTGTLNIRCQIPFICGGG